MMAPIPQRIVDIRVGPPGGIGQSWTALYSEVGVEMVSGSTPNHATAAIYNLSGASLQSIELPGQQLQILAGETIPGQIFLGDIGNKDVSTTRTGADIVTTIKATDGGRRYREAVLSQSYPAGVTRSVILADVVAAMRVAIGYISPTLVERTYPGATAFVSPARLVLDQLYAPDGGIWSIQSGVLQVLAPGEPTPGNAPLISEQTGMIGLPVADNKGVKVKSLFLPGVRPNGGFVVTSVHRGSGTYKITKVSHDLNSYGQKWETELTGVPV